MHIKSHFRRGLSFISNARCLYCYCMDPKTQKSKVCEYNGRFFYFLSLSQIMQAVLYASANPH